MTQHSSDLPPFYDQIYRYAYRFMRKQEDAEDVRQEVYLRYYQSIEKDESKQAYQGDQLRNYLYRIARNYMIDLIRKRGQFGRLTSDENGELTLVYSSLASVDSPEKSVQTSELQKVVCQTVNHLSPQKREILHLRYDEGMKTKDIAEIIGTSHGNIRRILSETLSLLSKAKELEALV